MRDDAVVTDVVPSIPAYSVGDPLPPPQPPTRPRRRMKPYFAFLAAIFVLLFVWLAVTAPLKKSLQPVAAPSLTLVSGNGEPIARRGAIIGAPVNVKTLPFYVPNAFVAIEDQRFYIHIGVDPWGMLRAAWHNARAGSVREGGSTITQQLAKLSFLTPDRTAARKLQEVLIAFWLEAWLSKEEILSRYLSNVYFGDNVYGLSAAARHYFSKDPAELTPAEAAMLAGLVKAPTRLAPTSNYKAAAARSKLVLAAMADAGVIKSSQAKASTARLHVSRERDIPTGTYFADWVMPEARSLADAPYGARTVTTTLDSNLQRLALNAVRHAGLGKAQVAMVVMRPDGAIVAMVGGKDYKKSPFNRATQARRQSGSTFKLFVYLAALRSGMTPNDLVSDTPVTVGNWSPKNHNDSYRGQITLREAFAVSSNVAAVRLSEQVGRQNVIRAARDLGIRSPLSEGPSVALGTSGLTLLELTSAYAAVAGNSYPVTPRGLPEVRKSWYERFWNNRRSFDGHTREMLLDLLAAAANDGTGRAAALQTQTFGKTGTSQDSRDAVFVGFAGDLVAGVWVGNDDNTPLGGMAGGGPPARIWRDFMAAALKTAPATRAVPQVAPPPIVPDDEMSDDMIPPDQPMDAPEDDQGYPVQMSRPDDGPADDYDRPDAPDDEPPPPPEGGGDGDDQY